MDEWGEYAFPRYIEARCKGSIDVAEIDPAVTAVARSPLAVRRSSRMRIHHQDACLLLQASPADTRYDVVGGDSFNDFQVPFQLTTRECNDLLARHLSDNGLDLFNVHRRSPKRVCTGGAAHAARDSSIRALLRNPGDWPPGDDRRTYVIVAANHAPTQPLPSTVSASELDAFVEQDHSVGLTDDYVRGSDARTGFQSRAPFSGETSGPPLPASNPDSFDEGWVGPALYARRRGRHLGRLRRMLELDPTHSGGTFQLAKALDFVGSAAEARPLWEKALRMAEGYHEHTAGIAFAFASEAVVGGS
jgi:hypothetical protein